MQGPVRNIGAGFGRVFDELPGLWKLEREISTGEVFSGQVTFSSAGSANLHLEEEGYLSLVEGRKIPASREWYWCLKGQNALAISYDLEGDRPYHHLQLNNSNSIWTGTAEHLCGDDLYVGDYRLGPTAMEIRHKVTGPKKDYSIVATYRKI